MPRFSSLGRKVDPSIKFLVLNCAGDFSDSGPLALPVQWLPLSFLSKLLAALGAVLEGL